MSFDWQKITIPTTFSYKRFEDYRGSFSKLINEQLLRQEWCKPSDLNFVVTENPLTFRGFHWQESPFEEYKIIFCLTGSIIDFSFDTKLENPKLHKFELTSDEHYGLIIPPLWGHGYLTNFPNTSVLYLTSGSYHPESEKGARWNDQKLNFPNEYKPKTISEKDGMWPNL